MIVLLGKSGSGKDTITNYLVNNYGYKKLITYTTRPMRPSEKQDVQYHFITKEDFNEKRSHGFFLEYKSYDTKYDKWYYGSAKEDYKKTDDKTIVILTPDGYLDLLSEIEDIEHDSIYLKVSILELQNRLFSRGDNQEEILRRLEHDNEDFDYIEYFADRIIVNENKTIEEVVSEIIRK